MQAQSQGFLEAAYHGLMPAGRPTKRPRAAFGACLLKARRQAGLSQEQLGAKVGVSQRTIAYWEREPVALRAEQVSALADVLGVTTDYLMGRDNGKARRGGPSGKMRQLFETASRLPRSQQKKVAEVIEPFILQHAKEG